jgi:hypothetical protein
VGFPRGVSSEPHFEAGQIEPSLPIGAYAAAQHKHADDKKTRPPLGYLAPDKSIHFFRLNSQVRGAAFEEAGANMILFYSKETTEVGTIVAFVKILPTISEADYKAWTTDAAPPSGEAPPPK